METKWILLKLVAPLMLVALLVIPVVMADAAEGDDSDPKSVAVTSRPASQPTAAAPKSDPHESPSLSRSGNRPMRQVPDPKQTGGEPDGVVQVANLVYAGTMSSKCFSDHFLTQTEQVSVISTSRRFHTIKLGADELFNFPLVIMTGEGEFTLPEVERENLRQYVERGGFLLASAGCSSREWDRSFRSELARIFPDRKLEQIEMEHPIFHMIYDIKSLRTRHGRPHPLEGISIGGRLGIVYSQDGLNDTDHTTGCCCCGGNEIKNAIEINVNLVTYALIY